MSDLFTNADAEIKLENENVRSDGNKLSPKTTP